MARVSSARESRRVAGAQIRVADEHARALLAGDLDLERETARLLVEVSYRLAGEPPPKVIGFETPLTRRRCAGCGIGLEFKSVGCQTCRSRAHERAKRAAARAARKQSEARAPLN